MGHLSNHLEPRAAITRHRRRRLGIVADVQQSHAIKHHHRPHETYIKRAVAVGRRMMPIFKRAEFGGIQYSGGIPGKNIAAEMPDPKRNVLMEHVGDEVTFQRLFIRFVIRSTTKGEPEKIIFGYAQGLGRFHCSDEIRGRCWPHKAHGRLLGLETISPTSFNIITLSGRVKFLSG